MSKVARVIASVAVTLMGMTGLYLNIEYSGWVLFVGLIAIWNVL